MSNCPGCDSSSTTYSRCNPPVSTNCVFYQGKSEVCKNDETFTICKGENLSDQQLRIFEKVCKIAGDINITSIEFPCSLQDGWKNQDKTILNLLDYMTTIQCNQNKNIEDLNILVKDQVGTVGKDIAVIDPFVEVCLACCTPSGLCGTPILHLSEALDAIVRCVCEAKTTAEEALQKATDALYSANQTLAAKIEAQQILINSLVLAQPSILSRISCLESRVDAYGIPSC